MMLVRNLYYVYGYAFISPFQWCQLGIRIGAANREVDRAGLQLVWAFPPYTNLHMGLYVYKNTILTKAHAQL